ncbi:11197_t:CDS:2 [Gigaspora margarita]|uniref:11197_t:CDS:1 n=1 Tax=Gigaspora margarita TaxID=4874 RepID=A0ABN7V159_GIGMA|nr:11197_t:CDS:2 [Gigaspora margarita]
METELQPIPKKDYEKIKENSISLNIPTPFDMIIYYFDHEFLTKHKVNELITYWYGYYLNEGIGGEKNVKEASDLFKQAADKNVLGAQLCYAFSLLNEDKREEFIEYLTQVADNEKGKKYIKLAAKKGYKDAIELCKKNEITY